MIERVDHVGVADLDERIQFFTEQMGMHLKRRGTHNATGGRIAFLADAAGFKLELIVLRTARSAIETPDRQTGLMPIAFRVDDLPTEHERLCQEGLTPLRGPLHLNAAKADTALLKDAAGMEMQIICYEPDSPDV
ncbi:MAG: VOC family protein [Thermostichus sp. HHBFW_bins_43]